MNKQASQKYWREKGLTKEKLEALYWKQGLSSADIARIYNIGSAGAVRGYMHRLGLRLRDTNAAIALAIEKRWREKGLTKERLEELYWKEGHSSVEIARMYDVNYPERVRTRMHKLGIPLRDWNSAATLAMERKGKGRLAITASSPAPPLRRTLVFCDYCGSELIEISWNAGLGILVCDNIGCNRWRAPQGHIKKH